MFLRSLVVAIFEIIGAVSVCIGAFQFGVPVGWVTVGGFSLAAGWRVNQ